MSFLTLLQSRLPLKKKQKTKNFSLSQQRMSSLGCLSLLMTQLHLMFQMLLSGFIQKYVQILVLLKGI